MKHPFIALLTVLALPFSPVFGQEPTVVLVAAASDLQQALPDVIAPYEAAHPGVQIQATYGSSGKICSQIENGAPFDLFLSADLGFPKKLIADGKGLEADLFVYALGRLVLWAPKDSPIAVQKLGIQAVLDPAAKKVAIANPEHAPYGQAAVAALQKLGVYEAVKDRLVLGENVAQTAQFIQSGAADLGLISRSLAASPALRDQGIFWEVPADAFPAMQQAGLILSTGKNATEARHFEEFLRSEAGGKILLAHGLVLPP